MPERFVVSYDIWEEKFKVTMPEHAALDPHVLTAAAAEAWCLENLAIGALGLAPDRPFWLRFELRTADPKDCRGWGDPGSASAA